MTTLTTLLPVLERAEAGNTRLDLLIAYIVDDASPDDLRRIELFSSQGYVSERIAALLGYVPQPYTMQLDAAVPGENIVLSMYSAARKRWVAIHRRPSGAEDMHWGATEPLARRIAALHSVAAADTGSRGRNAKLAAAGNFVEPAIIDTAPAEKPAPVEDGEPTPWKILF